jgi:hypothetical protein
VTAERRFGCEYSSSIVPFDNSAAVFSLPEGKSTVSLILKVLP